MLTPVSLPTGFSTEVDHLAGRVLLFTGATGGIGGAAARACARCGATLILASRNVPAAERLYDEITAQKWPEPVIFPVDLGGATLADYETMAQSIDEQFGSLDGVVHTAAEFSGLHPLDSVGAEAWTRTMVANVTAVHWINQAVLELLKASDQPRIVITLDDPHRISRAYWGSYGVSKAALATLTAVSASEYEGYGIKVNAVQPPPTDTALRRRAYVGDEQVKLATAADVAPAFLYLLGDHERLMSGEVIQFSHSQSP